ncbi:MAG: hypothetical protein ACI9CF_002008 [Candidatus Omnitrophota bacterium]
MVVNFKNIVLHKQKLMKVLACLVILASILVFAGILRQHTFWLPHWRGDQGQYITLAMKLDALGLKGYNLRESKMQMIPVQKEPSIVLTVVSHGNLGQPGDLLNILANVNHGYYDEPLHMRAPLFPYVIMWAHRLLASPNQPYVVCSTNLGKAVLMLKPPKILQAQFWVAIIPFSANLLIIALICLMGWLLFNDKRIGLYASLIMAVNPVSIWLVHRLLSEDVAVVFVTLALLIFKGFNARKHLWVAWISGAIGGLAVLTNQKMGLILCIVFLYCFFCRWEETGGRKAKGLKSIKPVILATLDPSMWVFLIGLFSVSGFWFFKVHAMYGDPLHMPGMGSSNIGDMTGWFTALSNRPHPIILFSLGVIVLCPLFIFAFAMWRQAYRRFAGTLNDKESQTLVYLWLWVLVFFVYLADFGDLFAVGNKEHRYFYPAYPAICLIAAYGINKIRLLLSQKCRYKQFIEPIFILVILLTTFYTFPPAFDKACSISMLF